jgi:hypothetical protein
VDFQVGAGNGAWLIELVSVQPSDALKAASWEDDIAFGATLSTDSEDPRRSLEGEMLLVQQKIGEKVFDGSRPTKFPPLPTNSAHAILTDVRGMGLTGADDLDCKEIAYGQHGLPNSPFAHFWTLPDGTRSPILGLFDPANHRQRAARLVQERIHFLIFRLGDPDESRRMLPDLLYCPNPRLFGSQAAEDEVFRRKPVPGGVLSHSPGTLRPN